jgi:predicted dehydrogenase
MSNIEKGGVSRRDVIKATGQVAAVSALAGVVLPQVHAGGSEEIKIALVGCGGRGTGAAGDAMNTRRQGPISLVAMADVFPNKLNAAAQRLQRSHNQQVQVPEARRFIGFDGYRKAMDSLSPGDLVILATPPAFRWVQFSYAIEKGLNVFMEKPITVDGPTTRKMLALADQADQRNLKVGVGLMCRHCEARGELFKRVKDGQLGDLTLLRAYRMAGPTGTAAVRPKEDNTMSELMWQIHNFHGFLWLSGGAVSDFLIHNIDECCWIKDAWPVSAKAAGGRHYRENCVDQNFDNYEIEYTFADGAKLFMGGRTMPGCHGEFASYCHGTRGSAVISQSGHAPSRARIFRGQNMTNADVVWRFEREEPNPYQLEWNDLVGAIRNNRPYNEVKRGAEASLITSMGRMAAHTGQVITRDQILNHDHEFAPEIDKLTLESPSPLRAGPDGKYPVPQPGIQTRREY